MDEAPSRNRRGPYAKSTKQRDVIIRAALEYFGQHGYHGASMREIARQVGLSQAGLLHHFPTKAELLIAVLEDRDNLSGSAAAAAARTGDDPLEGMTAVVADNARQRQLVQMFTVISAEATDEHHPAHDYFRRRSGDVLGLMRMGLDKAKAQGLVEPELDVEQAARQCQALMYGLQVQWLFDPTTDMVATFGHYLELFRRNQRPNDTST